jgi:hypothetical protein
MVKMHACAAMAVEALVGSLNNDFKVLKRHVINGDMV